MSAPVRQRGFLLSLAAEGMASLIPGCAEGPAGQRTAHAIDVFGPDVVERWSAWLRAQAPGLRHAAISELADLPASRARPEALAVVDRIAPDAPVEDRGLAVEYLCAIPRSCQPALVLDPTSGGRALPTGQQPDDPAVLLRLLPVDVPPFAPGSPLPDTPYQLGDLSATLLGVTYRASQEGKPLVVRLPIQRSLVAALRDQRTLLEQVREAGRGAWSDRLVRLLDFDLDHALPFLIHEPSPGGDLAVLLTNLREQAHRGFAPDEAFRIIEQVAEGLAFAHERGLVHGDLKPVNVIVSGESVKLADLGSGVGVSGHALLHSRVGAVPVEQLSPSDRVWLARGAASLLYLSPERGIGRPAEPNDDLYSLGVLWYQLLAGDLTRSAQEERVREVLERPDLPKLHREAVARCLGRRPERPADAVVLLAQLRPTTRRVLTGEQHAASIVSPEEVRHERQRKRELLAGLRTLRDRLRDWQERHPQARRPTSSDLWLGLLWAIGIWVTIFFGFALIPVMLATQTSVFGGFLVLVIQQRGRRSRAKQAFLEVKQLADRLAEANPDEVQAWGGEQVLVNGELLLEIIAALEEDMRALAIEQEEEAE
jgi:serine/threonine protein kinase